VGLGRVELPTSPLSGVRSNQLSYRPALEAPLPARAACGQEPGGSHNPHSLRKVSRTRLNARGSYAASDHRAIRSGKEGPIRAPAVSVQERELQGSWINPIRLPEGKSAIAEGMGCHEFSFRKEVIQPQVLLRLPCYDFTPIMNYTLGGCSLAVSSPTSSATHFRDVTGGVYKARERIHRGILIRDY
jgi:hypothetical protein